MKKRRQKEPYIIDPDTHPRRIVGLHVAADFLGLDERTLRRRIDEGALPAERDGKVYRIRLSSLLVYQVQRRLAS